MIRDTIKKHSDFATTDENPSGRCSYFLIRAKAAKFQGDARYGLVVTKKSFRLAVTRSRVKRMLRDWIAFNEKMMCPDMDYIFIARRDIVNATRTDGRVAMRKALNYIRKTVRSNAAAQNAQ
ncbi:MAG: ribonuclease P protein component [Alphaproteobacteria bacterium]|nr:ribonuclease P protein component [Alphaproteobacteria bacterium]